MAQVTLRVHDALADQLRRAAKASGRSVNAYATAVLSAAVDPDLAGGEAERLRERLAQAGLLEAPAPTRAVAADEASLAGARRRAGTGRSLSGLVTDDRR